MQQMMTNMDFYVTPVLNIDGYIFSWTTVSTSVPWIFTKLILKGSYSQSRRCERDKLSKRAQFLNWFFFFFGGAQDMDDIQIHFRLKQPFTKSISNFHSLNGRKE